MSERQDVLIRLSDVSAALAEGKPIGQVLLLVSNSVYDLLECSQVGIWTLDREETPLELASESPEQSRRLPSSLPLDGTSGLMSQTIIVSRGQWPIQGNALEAAGYQAAVCAPLLWRGQSWGVLCALDHLPDRVFSASDVRTVELFAREVGAATGFEHAQKDRQEFAHSLEVEQERLLHIQVAIRQMLDEPDVTVNLVEVAQALQALGWRQVVLALFDDGVKKADTLVTLGYSTDAEAQLSEGLIPDEIWQNFEAGKLEHTRLSGVYFVPFGNRQASSWDSRDLVFAPLHIAQGGIAGLIRLGDPVDGMRPSWEALRPLDILAGQTAYIVENARLLAAAAKTADVLAEQVDELSMMHRADRELSSHLNVDRIMRLTMDWALRRTGAETGVLVLMTDDRRGLIPTIVMGRIDRELFPFDSQTPLPLTAGIMGRAARTGKTQAVWDVMADRDYIPVNLDSRSHLSVPLLMRGEVLGVITLASTRKNAFNERDVSFLERLARRAAVALDNARLFKQSEQMADDMAVLYTASRTITSTLERDAILQRIAQAMTVTLESSSTVIFDYAVDQLAVRVLAAYRLGTAHDANEVLPPVNYVIPVVTYPAFQTAIEQQHPLVLRANDPSVSQLDRAHLVEDRIHAMLIVPLVAQEQLVGLAAVLEGRHDRIFSANDVFKAETLASQASVALRQSQLYSEVLDLEKLKSEMIRMASHDLRNPLNNIMGYLELLAMTMDQQGMTPDQDMYLDTLRRSTQTMKALLEDLLTLERIESERQGEWEHFDLGGLLVEVIEAQQASAVLKHQVLTVERANNAPYVNGSVTQLRQAIANLVGNAVKYTPEDGHIQVRLKVESGRPVVEVEDDGYGISLDRQTRIFERFYRAREPGTDHIAGTGLGLSLVKTVVDRHGGQVWFRSSPGSGSLFAFSLPSASSSN